MVKDGLTLSPVSYSKAPGSRARGTERVVDPALVYRRYEDGATIVLEGLQRYWEPLTFFCRDLEVDLGHRLQVNAYVTPPGSRGFAAHRDTHDVFVLQVSGSKDWKIFDRDDEERVLIDHEMLPGDSLYIPEGWPHAAETATQSSAHLTVGVVTYTARDIVKEIVKEIERGSAFGERLGSVHRDRDGLRREVERVIDDLRASLDKVDLDGITDAVARKVMSTGQPVVRGQLRQLELLGTIEGQTLVRRRRGAACHVTHTEESIRVLLTDRELVMPRAALEAMEAVASRHEFRVRDLHAYIDPESALVLIRRLVREGFLEVAA